VKVPRLFTVSRRDDLRVAIAGGGTGGHAFPALAVAEAVTRLRPSARVLFVGSKGTNGHATGRTEPDNGIETLLLSAPRPKRTLTGLPLFGARLAGAVAEATRALARFRPHVVVGAGGYASVAPAVAAKLVGAKLVLLEQNAIPGRANRLLARLADEVHTQFTESVRRFPARTRVRVTGNPVREKVLVTARRRRSRKADGPFTLLVMGGSQGARSVNEALWEALPRLGAAMPRMRVYHCAGWRDEDRARARLFASGLSGRSWGFCNVMHELYACADLAVARAGATSIAELAAAGLPAVLVPYPHATDRHQDANAEVLAAAGACEVVSDAALDGKTLAEAVLGIARDPVRRARMARSCLDFATPGAAAAVARRIEALAGFARPIRIAPAVVRRAA
jgi:UDP-N-acetylglucosamine--N-acetylmuramyl-(pentapeptide) pyrophosphoryl-undecaprenol N-acetylglucosamine transferase